jgi:hypothetical protein
MTSVGGFFFDFFEPLPSSHFPRSYLPFLFLFTPLMACRDAPPFQIPLLEPSTRFGPLVPSARGGFRSGCLRLHMWHSTPATNYQARTYVHSRYHCMGLTSKRTIEPWMSPHDFPQHVHSTYSDSVDLTSLGPLQVDVKYVLFREMLTSRCVSGLSARCTPPCHVRLNTEHIARVAKIMVSIGGI